MQHYYVNMQDNFMSKCSMKYVDSVSFVTCIFLKTFYKKVSHLIAYTL